MSRSEKSRTPRLSSADDDMSVALSDSLTQISPAHTKEERKKPKSPVTPPNLVPRRMMPGETVIPGTQSHATALSAPLAGLLPKMEPIEGEQEKRTEETLPYDTRVKGEVNVTQDLSGLTDVKDHAEVKVETKVKIGQAVGEEDEDDPFGVDNDEEDSTNTEERDRPEVKE